MKKLALARLSKMSPEEKAEFRKRKRALSKARYYMLKEHGICVCCGQAKAEKDSVYCWACKLYHNQYYSGYVDHASRRRVAKGKRRKGARKGGEKA